MMYGTLLASGDESACIVHDYIAYLTPAVCLHRSDVTIKVEMTLEIFFFPFLLSTSMYVRNFL